MHSAAKAVSRAAGDELVGGTSRPMYRGTNFRPTEACRKDIETVPRCHPFAFARKQSARQCCLKNLESVATAPQLREEIRKTRVCVGGNVLSLEGLDRSPKFEIAAQGARIVRQASAPRRRKEICLGRNKQRLPGGLGYAGSRG